MYSINYLNLLFGFLYSFILTLIIIKLIYPNLKKYIKKPKGPQIIHEGDVSRLGGLSIFIAMAIFCVFNSFQEKNFILLYFIISIPIFVIGIFEDITQLVSPIFRLMGSAISAILFIKIFDILITSIGINSLNFLLNYNIISIFFTLLCVIFLTQAFNIIDGLNGLSLITAILSFLSVGIISYGIEDFEILNISFYLIFIILGVLIFNFPFGKIFIGDSGAYIIGLYVAVSLILLAERNTDLPALIVVQIIIYPSYELIRSFVRRLLQNKNSILKPDHKHLHSILYINNKLTYPFNALKVNIFTSLQIIFIQIINFIYLVNFYDNKNMIIAGIITFIIIYELLYNIFNHKIKNYYSNRKEQ